MMAALKTIVSVLFFFLFVSCDDLHGRVAPPPATCDRCRACRAKLAEEVRQGRDCESNCWSKRNREYLACKVKAEAWRNRCVVDCADAGVCAASCREIAWNVLTEKCSRLQRQDCCCNTSDDLCDCRGCDTPVSTP